MLNSATLCLNRRVALRSIKRAALKSPQKVALEMISVSTCWGVYAHRCAHVLTSDLPMKKYEIGYDVMNTAVSLTQLMLIRLHKTGLYRFIPAVISVL